MKSRIKKGGEKEKNNDQNKKTNVLEWEQERAVCPGADLKQSNIYHRKVEKTYIIVSTCMINFRIESSYIFVFNT